MSTPWTMTRLVRWRVRDWASCFLACRFPLDNEPDRYFTSTPTQMPIRTMVIDRKSIPSRGKDNRKKISRQRKGDSERRRKPSSLQAEDSPAAVVAVTNKMTDDSSWPQVEDEDYIVFCFKEDGAFDVLPLSDPNFPTEERKNGNSEASNYIDLVSANSRPVSRKLKYGEDDKAVKRCINEKISGGTRDIYPTIDGDFILSPQKDEEEEQMESIYMDKELAVDQNRMETRNGVNYDHSIVAVPTESSDSNHSDVSNGSFAFPVLGLEWSGSPVKMPKSEDLQLRKHKARCVGFQCCKF